MKPDQPARVVVCPACKGKSVYAASNPHRPFCSQRCKNLDFGAWASESFTMPVDTPPDEDMYGDSKLR